MEIVERPACKMPGKNLSQTSSQKNGGEFDGDEYHGIRIRIRKKITQLNKSKLVSFVLAKL